jgi:CheY-like chemotaxis protein
MNVTQRALHRKHRSVNVPAPDSVPRMKSILLVDDEPAILNLLTHVLQDAGYACDVARDGAEGLRVFQQKAAEIAAVLTDFNMPAMNGFDLVRAIRAIDPGMKVILSSGSLGESETTIAAELQVNAILHKPWTPEQVLACVNQVVQQR